MKQQRRRAPGWGRQLHFVWSLGRSPVDSFPQVVKEEAGNPNESGGCRQLNRCFDLGVLPQDEDYITRNNNSKEEYKGAVIGLRDSLILWCRQRKKRIWGEEGSQIWVCEKNGTWSSETDTALPKWGSFAEY